MAMTEGERRQFFRVEVDAPIQFRLVEEKDSTPLTEWIKGSTVDISLGGLKATAPMSEAHVETMIGQYVLIELSCQLPETSGAIKASASLAYFLRGATVAEATTVTFGVSFVTIDNSAKDTIGEFIRKRI